MTSTDYRKWSDWFFWIALYAMACTLLFIDHYRNEAIATAIIGIISGCLCLDAQRRYQWKLRIEKRRAEEAKALNGYNKR